jgi:hypothetical protein
VHTNDFGPLSYGQLHQWRDVENLPRKRWHEVNTWLRWSLPADVGTERVRRALRALAARCPSLRTTYELTDPARPRQRITTDVVELDAVAITVTGRGSAEEAMAATEEVLDHPFDLRERPAWRALILTGRGRATEVFLVRHHIVADGLSNSVLEHEFRTNLAERDGQEAVVAADGPLDLALWQRAPEQQRAWAAAVERWEHTFAAADGQGFPGVDPARTGALQCVLRSSTAHERARGLAARTRTSVSSVVLAVYTLAIAQVTGVERLVVESECSNRFNPRWRTVVSSMVQPVPVPVTAVDDLAEHITRVHHAAMTAYRRGMYDVDTVAALPSAAGHTATCEYNFFPWQEIAELPADSTEPVWEEPTSAVKNGCSLRAAEKDATLRLCLRTRGVAQDRAAAVMKHMLALLNESTG